MNIKTSMADLSASATEAAEFLRTVANENRIAILCALGRRSGRHARRFPGPALAALAFGATGTILFALAMATGMAPHDLAHISAGSRAA
jgi:hypothetical protein